MAELIQRWIDDFLSWTGEEWDNAAYGFIAGMFGFATVLAALWLIKALFPADSSGWVEAIGVVATVVVTARLFFMQIQREKVSQEERDIDLIKAAFLTVATARAMAAGAFNILKTEQISTVKFLASGNVIKAQVQRFRAFPEMSLRNELVRVAFSGASASVLAIEETFMWLEVRWKDIPPAKRAYAAEVTAKTLDKFVLQMDVASETIAAIVRERTSAPYP